MKTRSRFVALAAGVTMLAACGSSGGSSSSTAAPASQAPATQAPATQAPATQAPATQAPASEAPGTTAAAATATSVKVADSALGKILTTDEGFTVYGFTKDTAGESTCTGGCASAWPAVTVESDALPAGLDAKVFSVVEGANETYQLKAGQWPLYTFSGDQAPGDTNGQGSGGVWFVVAPDGSLIKG
jgi:predicted lipoprotein with Yx(FWY)xxD motif